MVKIYFMKNWFENANGLSGVEYSYAIYFAPKLCLNKDLHNDFMTLLCDKNSTVGRTSRRKIVVSQTIFILIEKTMSRYERSHKTNIIFEGTPNHVSLNILVSCSYKFSVNRKFAYKCWMNCKLQVPVPRLTAKLNLFKPMYKGGKTRHIKVIIRRPYNVFENTNGNWCCFYQPHVIVLSHVLYLFVTTAVSTQNS